MSGRMRGAWLLAAAIVGAGCYSAAGAPGGNGGTVASVGPGGTTAATGVPCDVAQALAACTSCHSDPPVGGAPMGLVTYDDLAAKAPSDPAKSVAAEAVVRMRDAARPMPPSGPPASAAEIAAVDAWVAAGMPQGTCGSDVGGSPYATPTQCTSGTYWTRGDRESPSMHPGGACITCHASRAEAPLFAAAGTVFPSAHEPTDCNGASAITVVLTDAAGRVVTLTTNAAGNFYTTAVLTLPYTAKVVANGRERAMSAAQTSGDCNGCHTESGANGAPGRIMAP